MYFLKNSGLNKGSGKNLLTALWPRVGPTRKYTIVLFFRFYLLWIKSTCNFFLFWCKYMLQEPGILLVVLKTCQQLPTWKWYPFLKRTVLFAIAMRRKETAQVRKNNSPEGKDKKGRSCQSTFISKFSHDGGSSLLQGCHHHLSRQKSSRRNFLEAWSSAGRGNGPVA